MGALSRKTGEVVLPVIPDTGKETLQAFVEDVVQEGVIVNTDEHKGYAGLDRYGNGKYKTVRHSRGEKVNRVRWYEPHGVFCANAQEGNSRHLPRQ